MSLIKDYSFTYTPKDLYNSMYNSGMKSTVDNMDVYKYGVNCVGGSSTGLTRLDGYGYSKLCTLNTLTASGTRDTTEQYNCAMVVIGSHRYLVSLSSDNITAEHYFTGNPNNPSLISALADFSIHNRTEYQGTEVSCIGAVTNHSTKIDSRQLAINFSDYYELDKMTQELYQLDAFMDTADVPSTPAAAESVRNQALNNTGLRWSLPNFELMYYIANDTATNSSSLFIGNNGFNFKDNWYWLPYTSVKYPDSATILTADTTRTVYGLAVHIGGTIGTDTPVTNLISRISVGYNDVSKTVYALPCLAF